MIQKLLVSTLFLSLNAASMSITTKEELITCIKNKDCQAIKTFCEKQPCLLIDIEVLKLTETLLNESYKQTKPTNTKIFDRKELDIAAMIGNAAPADVPNPFVFHAIDDAHLNS